MNEQLILKMVMPFVKNGYLTYGQFDVIFDMLPRKERYPIAEFLFRHNIELCDEIPSESGSTQVLPLQLQAKQESVSADEACIRQHVNQLFASPESSTGAAPATYSSRMKQSNEMLCHLIQQGNRQAEQDLCAKNCKLIRKYAAKFYHLFGNDLSQEDLEQAGYIGLLDAARRFDISRDNTFVTYATYWIMQAMSREMDDTGYTVRMPANVNESIRRATRCEAKYDRLSIAYEDRIPMIAEELSWPEAKVRNYIELRARFRAHKSLNMEVGEDGDTELLELLPDPEQLTPEDIILQQAAHDTIISVLNRLSKKESEIIKLRFGFYDGKSMTLDEIGNMYKVTRERVRQIQAKVLRKLKNNKELRSLLEA